MFNVVINIILTFIFFLICYSNSYYCYYHYINSVFLQISSHSKRILATFRLLVSNANTELGKNSLEIKLFHLINLKNEMPLLFVGSCVSSQKIPWKLFSYFFILIFHFEKISLLFLNLVFLFFI